MMQVGGAGRQHDGKGEEAVPEGKAKAMRSGRPGPFRAGGGRRGPACAMSAGAGSLLLPLLLLLLLGGPGGPPALHADAADVPAATAAHGPAASSARSAASGRAVPAARTGPRGARAGSRNAAGGGLPLSVAEVKAAQRRLVELGYWAGAESGPWDASWRQALIAFQKADWRKPTGVLTRAEWNQMQAAQPPAPRESGPAHLEVDVARQVLFMVDEVGAVSHILPISTGSGKPFYAPGWGSGVAETPCGHFAVFARGSGWHKSKLGEMYNPLYVVGGIAIHGSLDVPPRPVSHGCIRIPMYASHRLPQLVPRLMPVVVYGCRDDPQPAASVATVATKP
jgi:Putative peptidoglycan binding domain/L,D-transpeptidase catalytic domain